MLRVVQAKPEHIDRLHVRAEYNVQAGWKQEALYNLGVSQAATVMQDNLVFAVIGYRPLHDHAGQIWAYIAPEVQFFPIAFHRTCLRLLNGFQQTHGLRRMQITVRVDFAQAIKWALALGFEYEGRLKSYGADGSDYFMYAKVASACGR